MADTPLSKLIVDLVLQTTKFQEGSEDARKQATKTAEEIDNAFKRNGESFKPFVGGTMEARHAILLLGEETGVRVPRAIASMLASIGPVGNALAVAFAPIAVVGLIEVLGKAADKLDEFTHKAQLRANAEAKADMGLYEEINELTRAYDAQANKVTELTEGKAAALIERMGQIATEASNLGSKILSTAAAEEKVVKDQNGWTDSLSSFAEHSATLLLELDLLANKFHLLALSESNLAEVNEYLSRTAAGVAENLDTVATHAALLGAQNSGISGLTQQFAYLSEEWKKAKEQLAIEPDNKNLQKQFLYLNTQLQAVALEIQTKGKEIQATQAELAAKTEEQLTRAVEAWKRLQEAIDKVSADKAKLLAAQSGTQTLEGESTAEKAAIDQHFKTEEDAQRRLIAIHQSGSDEDRRIREEAANQLLVLAQEKADALLKVDIDYANKHRAQMERLAEEDLKLQEKQLGEQERLSASALSSEEQHVRALAETKQISYAAELEQLHALYASEYEASLAYLNREVELRAQEIKMEEEKNKVFLSDAQALAKAKAELDGEFVLKHQEYLDKLQKADDEYVKKVQDEWKAAFEKIGSSFDALINGFLQGTAKLEEQFKKLGDALIASIVKAQEKKLEEELAKKAAAHPDSGIFGVIGKLFGVEGSKPDGTAGNPLHVVVTNSITGAQQGPPEGIPGFVGSLPGVNSESGLSSTISSILSIGLPGLAEGGDVTPGRAYVVGEKHPELFIPGTRGSVIPMLNVSHDTHHPMQVIQNFHGVRDMDSFRRSRSQLSAATQMDMYAAQMRNG